MQHVHGGQAAASGSWIDRILQVYVPRSECMNHEADVIWTHIVSDLGIALAYFSLPAALLYLVRRRPDLVFGPTFRLFSAFIFACGATHLFNVAAMWYPLYRIAATLKRCVAPHAKMNAEKSRKVGPKTRSGRRRTR